MFLFSQCSGCVRYEAHAIITHGGVSRRAFTAAIADCSHHENVFDSVLAQMCVEIDLRVDEAAEPVFVENQISELDIELEI